MAVTKKTETAPAVPEAKLEIADIDVETVLVPIVGTASLIVHKFSEKAKRQMLDAMQGKKSQKTVRDPAADYEAAFHRIKGGGYGFPCTGFKQSIVSGARFYGKSVSMTELRQFLFLDGEWSDDELAPQKLIRIEGEPRMREDVVRYGMGSTDLAYRPEFREWSATLEITYVRSALSQSSLLSLISAAGIGVGVGEWRPLGKKSTGEFGTFKLDPTKKLEIVNFTG